MLDDKLFRQRDRDLRTFTIPYSNLGRSLGQINELFVDSLSLLIDFLRNNQKNGKVFAKTWIGQPEAGGRSLAARCPDKYVQRTISTDYQ